MTNWLAKGRTCNPLNLWVTTFDHKAGCLVGGNLFKCINHNFIAPSCNTLAVQWSLATVFQM